jgi:HEAT repeat protein
MIVDMNFIKLELSKVGIEINDIYELVNTNEPYPTAIPVLLNLLVKGIDHSGTKEGVVRALAVKEAIGKASPVLIDEYNRISKDKMLLRWVIGNTIYTTITGDDIENIIPIVQDKTNGMSRQMFVAALGKVTSEKAENVLINLLADEEVVPQALEALSRMKSIRAKDKISILTKHPKALIRKEAIKALRKIS